MAIVNGTGASNSVAAIAYGEAVTLAALSHVLTALSEEAMQGDAEAFNATISESRPHPGQTEVAQNLLKLLHGS